MRQQENNKNFLNPMPSALLPVFSTGVCLFSLSFLHPDFFPYCYMPSALFIRHRNLEICPGPQPTQQHLGEPSHQVILLLRRFLYFSFFLSIFHVLAHSLWMQIIQLNALKVHTL